MALSNAVMLQARKVMVDGVLKFQTDQAALLEICRLAADEADGASATRYVSWDVVKLHIFTTLKECDRQFGWKTTAMPGESPTQQQMREDSIYNMMAVIYLLGTVGVRVGL